MNRVERPTGLINDINKVNPSAGHKLGITILAVFIVLLVALDIFLMANPNKHLDTQTQCIVIQEIKGKNYKLNTCTGKLQVLTARAVAYKK